jgi:hypothetical protein
MLLILMLCHPIDEKHDDLQEDTDVEPDDDDDDDLASVSQSVKRVNGTLIHSILRLIKFSSYCFSNVILQFAQSDCK